MLHSPFFWFLAFLLLAELGAAIVNPYREIPAASEVARNPLPLRGWPEFLRTGPESLDSTNLAIISNSQGVSKEVNSAESTYPALLEQNFRQAGHNINIENWSLSGLRTDQIELLSMVAAQRQLDLLIIITEIKSLDIAGSTRLGANSDDLDLVAGRIALWPEILNSQVLHEIKWDDLLLREITLGSDIVRLRPYLLDLLAAAIPSADHPLFFGHRRSQRALESINLAVANPAESQVNSVLRNPGKSAITVPAATWEKQFRRNRLPTFHALFPGLSHRLTNSKTKLLWIWMPVYPGANTADLRQGAAPVYSIICGEITVAGATCLDLTDSLPAEAYATLSASSHLNIQGQQAMSLLLYPVIERALH